MNEIAHFRSSSRAAVFAALAAALVACGGGDGSGGPTDGGSTLGANAASYTEANDAGNNSEASSEVTGYTLDTDGLRISGSFAGSDDFYRFNTGSFTHIDVQLLLNGAKDSSVPLTLNSYVNDGYSTLNGNGYFINAWLSGTNKDYVLGVHAGAIGQVPYVLELKAH